MPGSNVNSATNTEADVQTERTRHLFLQWFRIHNEQKVIKLAFFLCLSRATSSYNIALIMLLFSGFSSQHQALERIVGSKLCAPADAGFYIPLTATRECMEKALERQARNDQGHSPVTSSPSDLVTHALPTAPDMQQPNSIRHSSGLQLFVHVLSFIFNLPQPGEAIMPLMLGF